MGLRLWLCVCVLWIGCGDDATGAGSGGSAGSGAVGGSGGSSGSAGTSGVGGSGGTGGSGGVNGSIDGGADDAALDADALRDAGDAATDAGPVPYVEPPETIDLHELPTSVPTVQIEIAPAALAQLEAAPYDAADVLGTFVDESGVRYENIDLNFRGAYALRSLIQSGGPQRNWKVKVPSAQLYRGRREWNFNYEPHLRQKLAYDLMRFAGVKCASARHVLLMVNGAPHGLYLEYEDPDNKAWLRDKLGDDTGDLYKAATDLPGMPRYFATTEYLGDTDADYLLHYNKKTNNNDVPVSYARLRSFLDGLNHTPTHEFPTWIQANFDVPKLIQYLVVASFLSNWDGLPQRPKNFWLYEIPAAQRWIFIPWDLDGTFSVATFGLNPMGTRASIFYQFGNHEPYAAEDGEGTERPLIRRVMAHPAFRDAYVAAYRQAMTTFLDHDYLLNRLDALEQLLVNAASTSDRTRVESSTQTMRQFIDERHAYVTDVLDNL